MGVLNTREEIWQFLTIKSVYVANGARYGHSCYRSRIGSHTEAIEYRMVAFSMTLSDPNPSFKVTLQFKDEYLGNSECYSEQRDVVWVSQQWLRFLVNF